MGLQSRPEPKRSFQCLREAFVAFECFLGLLDYIERDLRHLGSPTSRHSLQDIYGYVHILAMPLFSEYIPSYL